MEHLFACYYFLNLLSMYKNTSAQQILSAKNNPLKNISLLNPFECIEYLVALENSNCASKETGWQPMHFYKSKRNKSAFINLYKKNNSHGEFVFDYSWACLLYTSDAADE